MNIDLLIKRNHIFKKRKYYDNDISNVNKKQKIGIFTLNRFCFELVYFRFLKKCLKRKYIRRDILLSKSRYWIFIIPNFIFSIKSKNSRMGAGVGKFVRVCSIIKSGRYLILFKDYSIKFIKKFSLFLYKRWHIKFSYFIKENIKLI